ncbi:MAG TPA: matrixin family metalloprotease [Thermoanaerobaculia bacterium]|nr:matrixin family metalloprotease [Thermoanaerobaculia bacterium]
MRGRVALWLPAVLLALIMPATLGAQEEVGSTYTLKAMEDFNGTLRSMWMDLRAEQIEVLTTKRGRASVRIHRQPFRWVTNDERRQTRGGLTYLVDLGDIPSHLNLPAEEAEAAIDRAVQTWGAQSCIRKLSLEKRPDQGGDPDLFDAASGYGEPGGFGAADVVVAGWLPAGFFNSVVPSGGETVVALSVTFIFVGPDGEPTDVDKNGYLDTAVSEIYFNDAFRWTTDPAIQEGLDVESVALHEFGHSLGLGHINCSGTAMSSVYTGRTELTPQDHAALCGLWARWH